MSYSSFNLSKSVGYDEGLRSYLLSVMNNMAAGVAVSGLIAYLVSISPGLVSMLFGTGLVWVVMLAPIPMVFLVSWAASSWSLSAARVAYYAFMVVMGVSLTTVFITYKLGSVFQVFFITASMFAVLALYGYTTKKDLSGMGSFLIMGLWGLIAASLISIFFPSPVMAFVINIVGVIIFSGLTAYDMQKIKELYDDSRNRDELGRIALMGAMSLYLDFINLFIYLIQLIGDKKD